MPSAKTSRAAWIATAGLALLQGAVSLWHVWPLHTVVSYDTASYYVMARNVALGRGLVDTNLWHYLGHQSLPHPAGDYWPAGWPLLLGALLRIFGSGERTALFVCAALSILLPVAVFWLTRVVDGKSRVAVPLVAGVLVVFQGRLHATNVCTDVTLIYALSVLGALLAAFHLSGPGAAPQAPPRRFRRDVLCGVLLTVPVWFRAEAFFLPLAFAPVLIWTGRDGEPPGSLRARLSRVGALLLGTVIVQATLASYNLVEFGHAVPPTRSLMPWMTRYDELYDFLGDPSPATFWAQGLPAILRKIVVTAGDHFTQLVHQLPWMLPASALAGAGVSAWRRNVRALPVVLFVLATCLVQAVLVPVLANPDRTTMNATPGLCILAALAVAPLFERAKRMPARAATALLAAGWMFACCAWLWDGRILVVNGWINWRPFLHAPADLTDPATLASLDLHPDDVVLSQDPWGVAAVLDVRTVMWPKDGPRALDAVLATYRPRYVLTRLGERLPPAAHVKARIGRSVWYEIVP
jgi:hypothetical protein